MTDVMTTAREKRGHAAMATCSRFSLRRSCGVGTIVALLLIWQLVYSLSSCRPGRFLLRCRSSSHSMS